MIVLGIDPGSVRLGWGVVSFQGTKLTHIASGTVLAAERSQTPLSQRLIKIADTLDAVRASLGIGGGG